MATKKMKTYDLKQVSVVFMGAIITGAGGSGLVEVAKTSDAWSHHVGASGEECRARTNDDSAKVTIKLSQYSTDNAVLAALHLADLASGTIVGPLAILDKSGASYHESDEAYIQKAPDAAYDKAPGDRSWVLMCAGLTHFVGGN